MASATHPALDRILQSPERREAFDLLSAELPGSDLTTLLLGVFGDRAAERTIADVRAQYERDRFVAVAPVGALELARVELAALESASALGFETIALAPLAPLGLHHVLGGTPQNNVVSTSRCTEVAADPTNVLALEAVRRRGELLGDGDSRSQQVHLAAAQRVTRAQHFEGPRSFAHFSIFGMLTAGRDRGDHRFELEAITNHIAGAVATVQSLTAAPIMIRLTPFNPDLAERCRELCAEIAQPGVQCSVWLEREHGRGYYRNVGFKLDVQLGEESFEIGDGGDVDWMQHLMSSRKERTMIGGLGLERIAMLLAESPLAS